MGKAVEWLAEKAQTVGLRTTSLQARARAVGLGNYVRSLGLTEHQAADALGNAFEKDCALKRMVA
eukprot:12753407-Alexandrium_andersonii.AAC.1